MRFIVSLLDLCGARAAHVFALGLSVVLGAHRASGAEPPPAASVAAVAEVPPRVLPSYFTLELSPDGALFADGAALTGSEGLEAAARKAVASGAFAGAALFGDGEHAAARLAELRDVLRRAGFRNVIDAGRSMPHELSVVWKREHEQQVHNAARQRLVSAGVIEGEGGAPAPHAPSASSSITEPKGPAAKSPVPKAPAVKATATKVPPVKSAPVKPAKPEPKLELQTVGLHLAAPANQDATRKRLVRLFETQFGAFRRCHKSAPEHDYNASFGVDLLVPKAGGKAQVRETRTRLVGDAFKTCMDRVFQAMQFEPLPTGRDEIISYSVLFKAPGR
jgi:hypothetical protein